MSDDVVQGERSRHDRIRVLSWNLWWRFGDWERRFEAIQRVLLAERPDICGLQEVWSTADLNSAQHLADLLGMHYTFFPSPRPERWQERIGESGIDIGHAILSRWPIVRTAHTPLPLAGHKDDGRTVVFALIDAPVGQIPFFTTQLNSTPGQSAVRVEQVAAVARFITARGASADPVVLTGDFNAPPESDEVRLMEGHLTAPAVPGLLLVDAWRYADPGDHGWTWIPANPHVAAMLEPGARIDYIFVGSPGADLAGHVRSVRRVAAEPVGGVWASDHAGVLAELHPGTATDGT